MPITKHFLARILPSWQVITSSSCTVGDGGHCDLEYDMELPRDIRKFWAMVMGG